MNKENWDKFCAVFSLDVKVSVPKKVTRQDIIMTLLSEGEIAFKGKSGSFLLKINDKWDKNIIDKLIFNDIKNYSKEIKQKEKLEFL